jgi:hypothetical protein
MSVDEQSQTDHTYGEVAEELLDLIRSVAQEQLQEALPKLKEEIKAELRAELLKQEQP